LTDAEVQDHVRADAARVRKQVNNIDREHMRLANQEATKRLQDIMDSKPKIVHRAVMRAPSDPSKYR